MIMQRWIYGFIQFFFLLCICHPAEGIEFSLSRFSYIDLTYLKLTLCADKKEQIQKADFLIGIRPFPLRNVYSLDPNFKVSYGMEGKDLRIAAERIAAATQPGDDFICIELKPGSQPGESIRWAFGEYPFLEVSVWNRDGFPESDIKTNPGCWLRHDDVLPGYKLSLMDENGKPVTKALVILELIGRAGLVSYCITDEKGTGVFFFFQIGVYEEIDYTKYLPDLNFSSQYMKTFYARFIIAAREDTSIQFETYWTYVSFDWWDRWATIPLTLGKKSSASSWEIYQ